MFPETFIPTYPDWVWRSPAWDGGFDGLMDRLVDQSVAVPGPATVAIGKAAKAAKAYVSVGVNELGDSGTLYNAQLMFAPDGSLIGKHRKLMPTGGERLVWGMGDGSDLEVYQTPFGRVGGLICWENFMPLARTAMYAKGVEIWTAPTWDNGENWVATLRHIAREGRVFVIGVTHLAARLRRPRRRPRARAVGRRGGLVQRRVVGDRRSRRPAAGRPPRGGARHPLPRRSTPRGSARSATSSIRSATTRGPTSSRSTVNEAPKPTVTD